MFKTYISNDLDMSQATQVIQCAQKFILLIPQLSDIEQIIHPLGKSSNQIITANNGCHIGEKDVAFYNSKDNSYQAVKVDGTGAVIINEVSETHASLLESKVDEYFKTPECLTRMQIKNILEFACSIGLVDMYNSDRSFIQKQMTPVGSHSFKNYGLYKSNSHNICLAIRLVGNGEFIGPAATPQKFKDGAVIVKQGENFRLVQSDIFERTYQLPNGEAINVSNL